MLIVTWTVEKITKILLLYIYLFMIMFRALVNSSHELNSRDINIIGIQNVHIKASIFKIAVLVYSFYFFLRLGLASGNFKLQLR